MFPVEVTLAEEDALRRMMEDMRTWLDHRRSEPAVFRCTSAASHITCRVDFMVEAEALAFAQAFGGRLVAF